MLRNLTWQATDDLIRAQFSMFHGLSDQINLTEDDRRRALDLDEPSWEAWKDFMRDGPLPVEPPPSEMLCRLGKIAFNLSVITGRTATQPGDVSTFGTASGPAPCDI